MTQTQNTATDETPTRLSLFLTSLRFAFANHKIPIILTGSFVVWVLIDWLSGWQVSDDFKTRWNTDLDQIVSFATLMTALFVWYGEINEDWKNNLPKRLTVRFENEQGQLRMLCIRAHLSDTGDIRALGQQIGSQMCNKSQISFRAPFVEQETAEILTDSDIGYFLHYKVTFTLTEMPDALHDLPAGKHKVWKTPFKMENLTIEDNNP
jgi:hypothetical protein